MSVLKLDTGGAVLFLRNQEQPTYFSGRAPLIAKPPCKHTRATPLGHPFARRLRPNPTSTQPQPIGKLEARGRQGRRGHDSPPGISMACFQKKSGQSKGQPRPTRQGGCTGDHTFQRWCCNQALSFLGGVRSVQPKSRTCVLAQG